ncbi:DUF2079 domain-containing protein [Rhodococcus sp. H29-C3]|uniref:DUF2079 domain-containing protein n=1 Tax=Rhodococcus sp. H29-C3 TaxID=3046307 RepID=UPI0024B93FCE|nr:DUF2079 domain-containing protein [Rhodococcus sp. H29-C3]MDJ0363168.1 DUF2079 domain-containing protein [Rhodococcus sp. H29-C3]
MRSRRHGQLTERGVRTIAVAFAAFAVVALPFLPLARLASADGWRVDQQTTAARVISDSIPHDERIAASNNLVPQFVATHDVSVFPQRPVDTTTPDWIVVNRSHPAGWPTDEEGDSKALYVAFSSGYEVRYEANDIEVLQRTPVGGDAG